MADFVACPYAIIAVLNSVCLCNIIMYGKVVDLFTAQSIKSYVIYTAAPQSSDPCPFLMLLPHYTQTELLFRILHCTDRLNPLVKLLILPLRSDSISVRRRVELK